MEKLFNLIATVCSLCALILIPALTISVLYIMMVAYEDIKFFKQRRQHHELFIEEDDWKDFKGTNCP